MISSCVRAFALLLLVALASSTAVQAASQTWDGGSTINGNFSTSANWLGDLVPGSTSVTTSTDTATFNAAIANGWGLTGTPIIIDSATQNISGLSFTGAAGNYFLGTTAGNALRLSSGGSIQILSGLTATNAIETINAPLALQGTAYTFANDSLSGSGAGSGTLVFGGGITGTTGATTLTLNGTNTNANTVSGSIGNGSATSLALTKSGAGTWLLSGNNTYTGVTTLAGGVLNVATFSNYGTAGGLGNRASDSSQNVGILFQGGTLQYTGSTAQSTNRAIRISTTGGATIDASGSNPAATLSFTATSSPDFFENPGARTLTLTGSNTGNNLFAMAIGEAGGTTSVIKNGAGTWVLFGANTYTGVTTVNGGILAVDGSQVGNRLAVNASVVVNNTGTFQINGVNALPTGANAVDVTVNSGGVLQVVSGGSAAVGAGGESHNHLRNLTLGGGTVNLTYSGGGTAYNGESFRLTGAITVTENSTIQFGAGATTGNAGLALSGNNTISVASGKTLTISAELEDDDTGGVGFTKTGAGTLMLAAANTYTGNTTVKGGTLIIGSGGSISNTASATVVGDTNGDNGALQITGGSVSNANGTLGNTAGSSGTATVSSGTWTNSVDLFVGGEGSGVMNLTGGSVSNANGFIGYNLGSSGTATVSGGTWTNSGDLRVGHVGTGVLNITGGAVSNVNGYIANNAGASGTANVSGGSWANSGNLDVGSNGTGVLNITGGVVSNTGSYIGSGAGANGTATVSGGTWTNSSSLVVGNLGTGVLNLTGSGVISIGGGTGTLTVGNVAGSSGTLNLGTGGTVGTLNAAAVDGGSGTAVVNFNHTGSFTLAANLIGSLVVNKQGAGTTILSGTNTYTGATTISAGTLQIGSGGTTGALSASSAITNNGTLAFNRSNTTTQGTDFASVISGSGGVTQRGLGNLDLSGANTYTGATAITGGVLTVSGTVGSIATSSGIVLSNGGALVLSNGTTQGAVDRLGNAATLTSYGGTLNYSNVSSSGVVYAETLGAMTLSGGQMVLTLSSNMAGVSGNKQTLTLSGLTQSNGGVVLFAATTAPNATTNIIQVSGATQTSAGGIMAPWATTGTSSTTATDYAVFDAAGRVLPAGLAATAENTWASAANVTLSAGTVLTGSRSLNSLRYTGGTGTLALAGNTMETVGILNGGGNLTITGGVVRQRGTAAASLYVTAGNGPITMTTPIQDNTGALTLVKSGGLTLALSGKNSFSGGVVLNAGALQLDHPNALGTGTLSVFGGSVIQSTNTFFNASNNALNIQGDFTSAALMQMGNGAVSLGTTPGTTRTITTSSGVFTLGGVISDGTTANSLIKAGSATLVLNGANTFTGSTTVTAGTLMLGAANAYAGGTVLTGGTVFARSAGALGSGSVTVGTNAVLNYQAGADAALNIGGSLSLTGGTSTTIGGSIGSTATSAQINVVGAATASGNIKVNVFGSSFSGGGTYTLLHGGVGSSLSSGTTYTLGTVYGNTNFTVGAPSATATDLTIPVTAATPLTTAFWTGGLAGATQVWAASNGSTASNWASTVAGAVSAVVPGAGTDVVFSVTTPLQTPTSSTLGADMTVRSLTQNAATTTTLNADGYTLTITPTNPATGITLNPGAISLTLNPSIVLGAPQTWTNNSSGTLNISGAVNNSGNLLTVGGIQFTSINGPLSGSGGLTKTGAGFLTLGGVNASSYTGATAILGGTLQLQGTAGSINASSAIQLANNATFILSNGTSETMVNRVADTVPIISAGGTINFNNTAGAGAVYAETLGAVTLAGGQTVFLNSNNQTGGSGNAQTLTLGSLTVTGAAVAHFAAATTAPNATTNIIQVSGAPQTSAGGILGPWATTGIATNSATDYAVFDAAGRILPANLAATAENTWGSGANVTLSSTAAVLTSSRSLNSLRYTGGTGTLALAGNTMETVGILNGGSGTLTITGGVVRQPGTAAASLYVTAGNAPITMTTPIQDNTGALTLVKSGGLTLALSGKNSFSGGVVLNAGALQLDHPNALGTGTLNVFGGSAIQSFTNFFNANNNPLSIQGDFTSANLMQMGNGAVSLGTTPGTTRTITVNSSILTLGGVISDGTTANSLIKAGSAILVLNGANTFTSTTTVTAGTLMLSAANAYAGGTVLTGGTVFARSAGALGSGSVTVGTNTVLNYQAGADAALNIGGSLSLTGGTSTTIGGSIGSTATSAQINVTGAATASGNIKVNVFGSSFSGGSDTYTLLHGGVGSSLSSGTTYTLGTVYGNTNFTVGAPSATATDLTIPVTAATPLTTAFWTGGLAGATQVWAASNGSTASNWASTVGGTPSAVVPGAGTDVIFSTTTPVQTPTASTLGADMTIKSLTQNAATTTTLNADGYTLTITPTNPATGITLNPGAISLTLNPSIVLGAPQTWTNNSSGTLNISGAVNNGGNLLTVSGTQTIALNGPLSGSGGLTKTGGNTLNFGVVNASSYTGATAILGGTLQLQGTAGSINASSAIQLANNATFNLLNGTSETMLDRVADGITLSSAGGTINFSNTAGAGAVYAETLGAVTLAGGQTIFFNNTDLTGGGGNKQTLTLSSFTRAATATAAFFATTQPNDYRNIIQVTGLSATPPNQILGAWATTGTNVPIDYAVVDAAGRILPAGVAATPSGLWSSASSAYTLNSSETLFATRNIAALRSVPGFSPTLTLALGSNLGTTGVLVVSGMTISAGTGGVVTLPTTAPGNFYAATANFLTIAAPIRDNTAAGVLTVVKSGGATLVLSGANTFTGGVALNAGQLNLNSAMALGTGPLSISGGTALDQLSFTNLVLPGNNPVTINGDFTFVGNNSLDLGTGAVSLGTAPGATRIITANSAGKVFTLGGVISNGTTANSLTHGGSGILVLAGSNTFTGSVAVTGTGVLMLNGANAYAGGTTLTNGSVFARNAAALGTGNVTVGANTALYYQAGADAPLSIGGNLSLTGGTSTALGGSIGSTASSAQINVSGAATATGAVKVNIYGGSFSGGSGTYTLLHGGVGSSLTSGVTYTKNLVVNNTNFTVGALGATATDLTVAITAATPLTTAFWKGGLTGNTQTWAASDGSTTGNWVSDVGGTATALVPGAGADVTFSATTVTTQPTSSTLGADMTIKSLTLASTASGLTLNADGYALTISPTVSTTGITLNVGVASVTLNPNIILGASQSWTNNSSNTLTVNGNVVGGANLLTLTGTGTGAITINGTVSGSAGLAKAGTGTLNLNGVNTFTGNITLASTGGITIGGVGSLGSGNYAGNITFAAAATLTHNSTADQILSGNISGPGTLTKSGTGTLTLSSDLAYTGLTTVSGGKLVLSGNNAAATGGLTITGGIVQFGSAAAIPGTGRGVTVNTTGAVVFDAGLAGGLQSTLLNRIVASSTGAIAVDNYAGTNLDFNAASLTAAFLGAVSDVTYTGTLTPNGTAWRLGGGGGKLTMASPLTGAANVSNTLTVGGYVALPAGNTYTGLTTINSTGTLQLDAGLSSLASGTSIVNNGTLIVTNASTESYGSITGTGAFYKLGAGNLTLTTPQYTGRTVIDAGNVTFSTPSYGGQLTINAGSLTVAPGNHPLRVNQQVDLNGGTLNLGTSRQYIGSLSGQVGAAPGTGGSITGSGVLTINQGNPFTFAGNLGASGTALGITKAGSQTLTLTNASSTTGALAVIGGNLTLFDAGSLASVSSVGINYATVSLDNTGTQSLADRLSDTAPVTLKGGTLTFKGMGNTLSTENLGALTVAEGNSLVQLTPVTTGINATDLIFAGSSVGVTQTTGATVNFITGGGSLGASGSGNPHVAFTVGGVAATTANVITGGLVNNIIPWATVVGADFASYIPYTTSATGNAGGIGALGSAGYTAYNATPAGGNLTGTAAHNIKSSASANISTGGLNINALVLSGTSGLTFTTGTDVLNLTSGGLLQNSGFASLGASADNGRITAGGTAPGTNQTLYLYKDTSTLTVNSRVVDNPDASLVRLVLSSGGNSGIFTLTDPLNSYSGGTVINRTTVTLSGTPSAVGNATAVIPFSVNGVVLNGATLTVSATGQQISSLNTVTLNGSSTLTLASSVSTTLAGLSFNSNGGTSTPSVTGSGSTLVLTGGITSVPTNVTVTPTINVTNLDLNAQAGAVINVTAHPDGNLVNNGTTPLALNGLAISSVIANGGITKTGTGVLNLTGTNTFAGQLTVEDGVLNVASVNNVSVAGTLGNSALAVILGKTGGQTGTLEYSQTFSASVTKPFTMAGGGAGAFQIDAAVTLTLSGLINENGSGGGGLTKTGQGTLSLSNTANTYTGPTRIDVGILAVATLANVNTNSSIGKGSVAGSAADLVFGGGTLQYTGNTTATTDRLFTLGNASGLTGTLDSSGTGSMNFTGTGAIGTGSTGARTLSLTGTNTLANTLTPVLADGTGGATALTKNGAGTWVINGANTFTGVTTVNGGILQSAKAGALSTTTAVTVNNAGSTLAVNYGGGSDYTEPQVATLLTKTTFSSGTTLGIDTTNAAGTATYGSVLSMAGGLRKLGSGTLELTQTNTYSGPTVVSTGTLSLNSSGGTAIPGDVTIGDGTATAGLDILQLSGTGGNQIANTAILTLNGTTTNAGIFRMNGLSETVGGLSGLGIVQNNTSGTSTLTLDVNSTDRDFAGILQNGAAGTLALTKIGTATQTLSGTASTYTGPTNVNGGTLRILGSSTSTVQNTSSLVSVANSAVLALDGAAISSAVSLAAGGSLNLASGLGGGLSGEYYSLGGTSPNQADFATLTALNAHLALQTVALRSNSALVGADFNFGTSGTGFPAPYNVNANNLEVRWTGQYNATSTGTYTFFTASDDGSMLFIDGVAVVTNNFSQGVTERSGTITLTAGYHDIVIAYNQGGGGYGMYASVQPPSGGKTFLPNAALFSFKTSTIGSLTGVAGSTVNLSDGRLRVGTDNTSTEFAGIITGTATNGYGGLTKVGTGVLTLSGANTYTGATRIDAGTLNATTLADVNTTSSIGTGSVAGSASDLVFGGGTLQYTSAAPASTNRLFTMGDAAGLNATLNSSATAPANSLSFTGTGAIAFNGSGARTLTLTGTNTGSNSFAPILGDGTGGATSLTKTGTGTWAVTGTNTFTGKTVVANGTLSVSTVNVSATAAQPLGMNAALDLGVAATSSGTLVYTGAGGTLAKNINALGNGGDTIQNSGSGLLTLSGTLTKNGTTLTLKGGSNGITVSGSIAGSSANSDLIIDGGTTTLTNANTYNGPTFIINGATLNADAANALPVANGRTALNLDQTGSGSSTLVLGTSQAAASITGAASSAVSLGGNALTLGAATGTTTFAGVISGSGGSLIKDSTSLQILTNASTYTGGTTIGGGELRVSNTTGSATGTGGIVVGSSGTLSGAGIITAEANAITLNGALVIGDNNSAAADLALGTTGGSGITLAGTGSMRFDLFSGAGAGNNTASVTASDLLILYGDISLLSGAKLYIDNPNSLSAWALGDQWRLWDVTNAGTRTGSFALGNIIAPLLSIDKAWSFDSQSGILSIVPEPGRASLLLLGLCGVLLRRRRR